MAPACEQLNVGQTQQLTCWAPAAPWYVTRPEPTAAGLGCADMAAVPGSGTLLKASSISAAVSPLRSKKERLVAMLESRTCTPGHLTR